VLGKGLQFCGDRSRYHRFESERSHAATRRSRLLVVRHSCNRRALAGGDAG
jgi:hypothetical protein